MLKYVLTLALACVTGFPRAFGADFTDTNLLASLRPAHPRLLVLNDQLLSVQELLKIDPYSRTLYQRLQAEGDRLLSTPPRAYVIGGPEHTLLEVSRDVEGRVWLLAGLYRLTADARFAARAREEMLAAAAFPDWYPKHFLDTAEMTAALGIGYDWLYDFLAPAERAGIRQAIVSKGLEPGLASLSPGGHVAGLHNNWVQVCNGGLSLGALAVAEDQPGLASQIISLSRGHMARIMKLFAPDGGFEEGPVYWCYATSYNVCYLAGLESALGTDFGLSQATGFDQTGNYRMLSLGPAWKCANFGDAGENTGFAPQMLWFAAKFHHPEYALHEHQFVNRFAANPKYENNRFAILELLWNQGGDTGPAASLPAAAKFDRVAIAYLRNGWADTNDLYLAFKGGDNRASHGHLDLGTFVLDAFGERWAADLGPDSYGLPKYFGSLRWTYYRLRTEGHNTLTIDNQNQDPRAEAPLVAFHGDSDRSFAVADLHEAYPAQLSHWRRGVRLLRPHSVLIQDELTPKAGADVVWNFHTTATITISDNGRQAALSQGGSAMRLRILAPEKAAFEARAVNLQPPQKPTRGVHNLTIPLGHLAAPTTIAVLMSSPDDPAPALSPLNRWEP